MRTVSGSSELSRTRSLNFSPLLARATISLAFCSATAICSGVLPSVEIRIWLRKTCSLRTYSALVLVVVLAAARRRESECDSRLPGRSRAAPGTGRFILSLNSSNGMPYCWRMESWNLSGSVILLATCMSASSRVTSPSTLMPRSLPFCTSSSWSILSRRALA